jgi:hypothetical protein
MLAARQSRRHRLRHERLAPPRSGALRLELRPNGPC